ncbi:MAG TPA: hypothetical protein PK360_18770 [bacterium]|nr:hypothetical protein [bacterium]
MSSSYLVWLALPGGHLDYWAAIVLGLILVAGYMAWQTAARQKTLHLRPQSLFEKQLVERIIRRPLTLRDKCLFRSFNRVEKQRRVEYYNHLNRFSQFF